MTSRVVLSARRACPFISGSELTEIRIIDKMSRHDIEGIHVARMILFAATFALYVVVMFTLASIPGGGPVETADATNAVIVNWLTR